VRERERERERETETIVTHGGEKGRKRERERENERERECRCEDEPSATSGRFALYASVCEIMNKRCSLERGDGRENSLRAATTKATTKTRRSDMSQC